MTAGFENFLSGTMKRNGLDPGGLREFRNPVGILPQFVPVFHQAGDHRSNLCIGQIFPGNEIRTNR